MQFIEFQNRLAAYPVFSLQDISKVAPLQSRVQLSRWEKKGYLKKIRRGFYCFREQELNRDFLFYSANKIYAPSYVSLETALKYYGFIPEEIFQIISVSPKKTSSFNTSVSNFAYRHIKAKLYWGYQLIAFGEQNLLLAEPEKAILDYLYVHPRLKTPADFEGMRINRDEFKAQVDPAKLQSYLNGFSNKQLTKRLKIFLNTIQNDQP
jgi:predicted transcriptional regulator of viral defense system